MRTSTSRLGIRGVLLLTAVSCLGFAPHGTLRAQEETPAAGAEANQRPFDVNDWREAGQDDQNGLRFRSCTIRIGQDGMLTGTIFRIEESTRLQTPVKNIELRLVQDGKALEMTTPKEEDGEFSFGPVQPGIYSLIGQGADGLVAYSFHVETAPEEDDQDENAAPAEAPFEQPAAEEEKSAPRLRLINSCAMNPGDMPMAIQLIQAFLGIATGAPGEAPEVEEDGEMEADQAAADGEGAPAAESPASRLSGSFKAHHEADEVQTTALSWHAVNLQEDGSLIGRVRILVAADNEEKTLETRPPEDMRVFLIQEGRVMAKAPCDPKGIFVIPDLAVGLYSFVSVGLDGFAAMTVDVLPAVKQPEEQENGGIRSASLRRVAFTANAGTLPNFDTAAVPPGDFNQLQTTSAVVPPTDQTIGDAGPLLNSLRTASTDGTQPGQGGSSFPGVGGGGNGGVGTPGGGGFGGGAGGGSGGGGNGGGVPEIDPASSGVGLSVMIALLFLLIDLRRTREATSN